MFTVVGEDVGNVDGDSVGAVEGEVDGWDEGEVDGELEGAELGLDVGAVPHAKNKKNTLENI